MATLLTLLLPLMGIGQEADYTTVLGQRISIAEDYTYDILIAEPADGEPQEASPFEMPTQEDLDLSPTELARIAKLEAQANTREVQSHIRLLRIEAQLDTLDGEQRKRVKFIKKTTEKRLRRAQKLAKHIAKLRTMPLDKRTKAFQEIDKTSAELDGLPAPTPDTKAQPAPNSARNAPLKIDKRHPYDILDDEACTIIFDDYDPDLKVKRKETAAVQLFGYTNPRLQRHFTDTDYVTTTASMARIDGDYFLLLQIDIASKSASKNYGYLAAKEQTRVRFVDGSNIYLHPAGNVEGKLQEYTGHTLYHVLYKLDKDDLKQMQRIEVDDIGIMWSTGFENYEIYDVEILQKLAKCVRK